MDRGETDHSSRAGAVSTGPSALDRSTSTVRSPVRSHDFVASQHAIPRRHHCRRLRASNCKKQVPASAAGAAGGQCGAPTAAPSAQDAAHHRRPSIEPGRTGAQRTSRRVVARAFLHRPGRAGCRALRTRISRQVTHSGHADCRDRRRGSLDRLAGSGSWRGASQRSRRLPPAGNTAKSAARWFPGWFAAQHNGGTSE
jgi:hypothetical protein